MDFVDWLLLDDQKVEPDESSTKKYKSYRFKHLNIDTITIENYADELVPSLAQQVSIFIPPSGSFETPDLRRYLRLIETYETLSNTSLLGLSLADQIRIAFSDMKPATICDRFPDIDLSSKRRYRCVAEYLLRQEELVKLKNKDGKLIKKVGNAGKPVVLYQGLPKLHTTLKASGFTEFIKNDNETRANQEPVEQEQLQ